MPSISLKLLGQVMLSKDRQPLSQFRSKKEIALLIYLAQTEKIHQRDFLATLLWESSSTKQSLTNLRTVLARLRKKVGDVLQTTRKTVGFAPEALPQVDSLILLHSLASVGQIDTAEKAVIFQKILATYQGYFLADFHLSGAAQFNQWVRETRAHIHDKVIAAYRKLGQYALSTDDLEQGIDITRRWLQLDTLDETAHLLLIQFLLKVGRTQEAIAHYNNCAALLQAELGIAPPAKMAALIKDARLKQTVRVSQATAVSHNLTPAHDQFFGRKLVQEEIHVRLDQPWCRIVTITGQGGVGKTRLATAIARSRLSQYQDGVWLVELADLDLDDDDLAETIAVEIAIALDLRLTGSANPTDQLLNHLQHKQMMLVLDNFEHLLGGMQIVLDIVQQCETVQLIVTSREPLRIRAEWAIALTGLSYPTGDVADTPSDAVDLFVARWAQQQWRGILSDEMAVIGAICRLVEGLPLAIELAAALTRHATPQAIADKLRGGFDVLTTSLHDVPQRHRGLNVVFEMSWHTLTPILQLHMAQLSIFRGGFTETAVSQITATPPHQLATLCEKSLLLFHQEQNRYTIHAVIRAYAAQKRPADDPTPNNHARYYLTLLAQHTEPLQKERPQESIKVLKPEIDNVRRSWQTALAERNADLLFSGLTSLSIYYQLRGLAREGEAIMQRTLRTAREWGAEGIALATRAGLEQARFQNRLGQYRPAMQTIETVLKLADQCDDRWGEGMAHVWLGESLWRLGEYDAAKIKLNHALNIGQALDAALIIGWCHHQLGIIDDIQSRYDIAHEHLEKACAVWQKLDNTNTLSVSLNSIGLVYRNQGDLSAAKQAMEQALVICTEQDNRYLQAMLLSNLSTIHIMQNDYFGAQYYLQLGLELASISGSLHTQSDIYINLGENFRFQGENDLAVQNLERGLKIAEKIGSRPSMAEALCRLADIKRKQGDGSVAERVYNQALEITRQDTLKSLECEVLIGLTKLFNNIDSVKAKQYSLQVTILAKSIESPDLLKRVEAINRTLSLK